ncbi:iron-siderophore ABC transporter substrate-binding protein [Devosia ginsengisoli]|uniref:Iron-siderophore ABC transporter substrate-binding protein n=1 Tax=Devosia ginsengisoli TaxID=400770 RepID=A0A5B8LUA4_9HYPH|nr:iron-siderophore ABC transporter substrate-binding protein [Devosia ginsengisoli]QDZ11419.1 iron-siderophore ABC transporter substrate-binding protein [Devosia ginsengisoli]
MLKLQSFLGALAIATAMLTGTQAQQAPFPVTIEHTFGTVTIPAEPQRVVALMDRDVDTLLALGIRPVAIRSWYNFDTGAGAWSVDLLGDTKPTVWKGRDLNYEAIAAEDPDLIVFASSGGDAEEYERLSQIAPTVSLPKGELPWGSTTIGTTRLIAQAVGREAQGEALIAELNAYLAAQKAAHPEFAGHTANYLDVHQGGLTYYARAQFINATLYQLGFSPIEAVLAIPAGESYATTSDEQAALVDADILLIYPFGLSREEMLAAHPTLPNIGAFKNGGAIILPDLAFSQASVISIPYALERLLPEFSAALAQ